MTQPKLFLHLMKINEIEDGLIGVSLDKVVWYRIPEELKKVENHAALLSLKTVSNTLKSITKIGGYRKIGISFKPELKKLYLDEEENFCLKDFILEEYKETDCIVGKGDELTSSERFLLQEINELKLKLKSQYKVNLNEIEKKFLIVKFNGKQEAASWLDSFEKECSRCEITDNNTKVEILKIFVEGNVKEWYSSNLMKLSASDWDSWKKKFLLTYEKRNWAPICIAFGFKYISGSLIEYVIKKERLLLEADRNTPELFRIYQIVFNLPEEIQNKLEREKIKTIDDLINELKKINDYYHTTKNWEVKRNEEKKFDFDKNKVFNNAKIKKNPCTRCESLGFRNRYHPIKTCWNKKINRNEINITEEDEDDENGICPQDSDIKEKN